MIRQAVSTVHKLLKLKDKTPFENDHGSLILEITLKKAVGDWKSLKIVPIHQLKVEHLTTEAKSQFMNLHDVLLVDSRVKGLLPSILGNSLYRKKRLGKPVNMKPTKVKKSIERALFFSELHVTGYGLSPFKLDHHLQPQNEIVQNICAVEQKLRKDLTGGFINIRQINLRSHNTMSIPIYLNLGSRNDVVISDPAIEDSENEAEEVDTVIGGKVKIHKDFKIEIQRDENLDSDMDADDIKKDKLACSNPMFKRRRMRKVAIKKNVQKKRLIKPDGIKK
ncbi:Ribosomal L1 domain-containing protein 1 [Nymphon striatum]|nr:Ribosomal L1 domain-containing protein 1 [Nymphon striatum]